MSPTVKNLKPNEVISVQNQLQSKHNYLIPSTTLKVSEFVHQFGQFTNISGELMEAWLVDEIDCEVLKLSSGSWVKGKLKISLEFIPEEAETPETNQSEISESESPLDDLRRELNQ